MEPKYICTGCINHFDVAFINECLQNSFSKLQKIHVRFLKCIYGGHIMRNSLGKGITTWALGFPKCPPKMGENEAMKHKMALVLLDEKICFIRLPPDTLQNF